MRRQYLYVERPEKEYAEVGRRMKVGGLSWETKLGMIKREHQPRSGYIRSLFQEQNLIPASAYRRFTYLSYYLSLLFIFFFFIWHIQPTAHPSTVLVPHTRIPPSSILLVALSFPGLRTAIRLLDCAPRFLYGRSLARLSPIMRSDPRKKRRLQLNNDRCK